MVRTREDIARLVAVLERAVATMAEPARTIFLAHRLENLGFAEIGRRLDLSVGDVERGFADAMVHLSQVMDAAEARGGR